jgi:hypothetical protein
MSKNFNHLAVILLQTCSFLHEHVRLKRFGTAVVCLW